MTVVPFTDAEQAACLVGKKITNTNTNTNSEAVVQYVGQTDVQILSESFVGVMSYKNLAKYVTGPDNRPCGLQTRDLDAEQIWLLGQCVAVVEATDYEIRALRVEYPSLDWPNTIRSCWLQVVSYTNVAISIYEISGQLVCFWYLVSNKCMTSMALAFLDHYVKVSAVRTNPMNFHAVKFEKKDALVYRMLQYFNAEGYFEDFPLEQLPDEHKGRMVSKVHVKTDGSLHVYSYDEHPHNGSPYNKHEETITLYPADRNFKLVDILAERYEKAEYARLEKEYKAAIETSLKSKVQPAKERFGY